MTLETEKTIGFCLEETSAVKPQEILVKVIIYSFSQQNSVFWKSLKIYWHNILWKNKTRLHAYEPQINHSAFMIDIDWVVYMVIECIKLFKNCQMS